MLNLLQDELVSFKICFWATAKNCCVASGIFLCVQRGGG